MVNSVFISFYLGQEEKERAGMRDGGKGEQFFPITDKEKLLWRRRKKLLPISLSPFVLCFGKRKGWREPQPKPQVVVTIKGGESRNLSQIHPPSSVG